ncbi:MAG: xanthine dehydrogenase family protein molybdopterin-binding subunit [Planctomycetes bacterium]|nr:xanthine dehydrogenase family protein molybdopterin-binding subunit [Planctomycetota bacterium]
MRELNKGWPKLDEATHLGKRTPRIDAADKVTGRAKYTQDVNLDSMLHAKFTLCPHGRARVQSVDASAAQALDGVVLARAIVGEGEELEHAGREVAVVAAESEEIAREAAQLVRVEYEVLEHNVADASPDLAGEWAREQRGRDQGDVDAGFAAADVVVEGRYGAPIVTHCCLEPHGSVVEFVDEEHVNTWVSTQRISSQDEDLAGELGIQPENVRAVCQHMGGGFGSKFQFDVWDRECARIAEETGRPVKAMLDRDHELMVAGSRPSAYADVRVGVKKDGTITAWESRSWGSGGAGGGSSPRLPYVFDKVPQRRTHVSIRTNTGASRPWRAPMSPQSCLITMAALDDAAAALDLDPLDFFLKNLPFTERPEVYEEELLIAARLMDWRGRFIPRAAQQGAVRRGLGLSLHTWGGYGHDSNCSTTIRGDGAVTVSCGTQDLGTGSHTVLAVVTAETLGLPVAAIDVRIGDSLLPPSGGSGGSTTVGGISSAARDAALDALRQLLARAAPELNAAPEECRAQGGRVFVAAAPERSLGWTEACGLIGPEALSGSGRTDPELMADGVGGAQMAEVEVDVETGVVAMKKLVAVQDCGTVVDLTTAESQVYGACIMGISSALFEERVMDPTTGACLNPNMAFYRLAGIGDVGEIVVHLMQTEAHHARGVIGIGEPPVISPIAAISNAVANAAGVRVPYAPFTPRAVLTALGKGRGR